MTDSQLQAYVQQMAQAMIESHGDKVRITLSKTESGWVIEITDPERDH